MSNIDKQALRKKLNRRLNDAFGFHRTSGGKHTTISLSIDECKSVLVALDELEAVQKTSAARLGAIDTTHKMFQRERGRAEAAEKRIAELETREVRLTDINEYLSEVHDKTLNRAFRLLAEGVRAGDVAAMRAAGVKVAAAGKGE